MLRKKSFNEYYNLQDLKKLRAEDFKPGWHFAIPLNHGIFCQINMPNPQRYVVHFSWKFFYITQKGRNHSTAEWMDGIDSSVTPLFAVISCLKRGIRNFEIDAHGANKLLSELLELGVGEQLTLF